MTLETDTAALYVLSRTVMLYNKGCTDHAPVLALPIPESVGDSDGDVATYTVGVLHKFIPDTTDLDIKLLKIFAVRPLQARLEFLFAGSPYKVTGYALWKLVEDDEDPSGTGLDCYYEGDDIDPVYEETPYRIYTVPIKGTHDTYEDSVETCKEDVNYIADMAGDLTVTPVVSVDCGKI